MTTPLETSLIRTGDGSIMTVKIIGTVTTHSLYVPKVFHVPELSEIGYRLVFNYFGVHVPGSSYEPDPWDQV